MDLYGWKILRQRETSWREIESRDRYSDRDREGGEARARAGRCGLEFQIITT